MKNMYKYLKLLPALLLGCNWSASAQTSVFNYTGSVQYFTVPANVFTVYVNALGGDGGKDFHAYSLGGNGGQANCGLTVIPGEVLNIFVGGAGANSTSLTGTAPGGYNGGGDGTGAGGSGGGSSDIRVGGIAVSNRVIVGGGGGGAGWDASGPGISGLGEDGGAGGGLSGVDGDVDYGNEAFTAGTQSYGFALLNGQPGTLYGTGGDGGGGGGYWGGYAGFGPSLVAFGGAGGGAGGSSYADPLTTTGAVLSIGGNAALGLNPGQVSICVPGVAGGIVPAPVCVGTGATSATFVDTGGTVGGAWSSSNTMIATVDPVTGKVTGVAFGPVTIFYTAITACGNATTSISITVAGAAAPITGHDTMCVTNSVTLSDTSPSGLWTSLSGAIASVVGTTGVVTGNGAGTTLITYTIPGGCYATTSVVVTPPLPAITGPNFVCVGVDSITLSDAQTGGTWYSGFPAVATVDTFTGVVTGTVFGGGSSTNIFYSYGGCTTSYFVTANDTASAIVGADTVCQGDATFLFEASGAGTWGTSSPGVATVTSGVVTGVTGGISVISYSVPGCPVVIFPMTVNPTPAPIAGITSVCIGSTAITLTDIDPLGTWASSNTSVATISSTGVVSVITSIAGLTTTITYTLPTTCYTTFLETTSNGPAPITGLTSICQGSSTTLSDLTPGGTWSSTALAIAQVIDTSGFVTGILGGTANISYTLPSGCFSVLSPFTVQTPAVGSVHLTRNPPTDTLCAHTPVEYFATPTNGGVAPSYTWLKFGVAIYSGTVDTFVSTPIHGDVITVIMGTSGVCLVKDTVADTMTLDIFPDAAPLISISQLAAHDTLQYLGEIVTFYSSVIFGGAVASYQWYANGLPIGGATSSSYATPVYGTEAFYCKVKGTAPCDSTTDSAFSNTIVIGDYLGISHLSNNSNTLSLFPNPSNGTLTLSGTVSSATNDQVSIEVSDMLGHIVYRGNTTPQNGQLHEQITLDNIANGTYLMHVNSSSGSEVFHFVIDK